MFSFFALLDAHRRSIKRNQAAGEAAKVAKKHDPVEFFLLVVFFGGLAGIFWLLSRLF